MSPIEGIGFGETIEKALGKAFSGEVLRIERIAKIEIFHGMPEYDDAGNPTNRTWEETVHNTITTLGINLVADLLVLATSDPAPTMPGGMKLGTSGTAASAGDTDILGDMSDTIAADFQAFESGFPQDGGTTVAWRSFWAAGEATNSGIQEVVIKSADGSADAISRITFTTINKTASDTLQITVTWTLSAP